MWSRQQRLNARGSLAFTSETAADASQKRLARTAIVIDPKISNKDQLRPPRSSRLILGTAAEATDFGGANNAFVVFWSFVGYLLWG